MKELLDEYELEGYLNHIDEDKQFAVYKQFTLKSEALELGYLLRENQIPFKSFEKKYLLDSNFIGSPLTQNFYVEIFKYDFPKVNLLIQEAADIAVESMDITDSHLNALNDKELIDILMNPDEWSPEAERIAEKILLTRNVSIDFEAIEAHQKQKKKALSQTKSIASYSKVIYSLVGLVGGLTLYHILILAALGMGYYYYKDKTTLPNGETHLTYDQQTRSFGKTLLIITVLSMLIGFVIPLFIL